MMTSIRSIRWQEWVVLLAAVIMLLLFAPLPGKGADGSEPKSYILGPGDVIQISVLDMDEIGKYPNRIDLRGFINLPVVGRLEAAGLTADQLQAKIEERLKSELKDPDVTVSITEMRSQPVSVLGSVGQPGVQQVQGRKTLMEVISQAGGLRQDAGYAIRIARLKEWGPLPLEGAKDDETGTYSMAEVGVSEVLEGASPAKNIQVKPNDVITVPKGKLVYVMGAVKKSGGFVLGEKEQVTVLEALSMAEGTAAFAKQSQVKILRKTGDPEKRVEIALNVGRILDGKDKDVPLEAEDILYVPVSGAKRVLARGAEAALSVGSGIAIWRGAGR
ncbi:MAG: polysaccharide biosynthesis/export family protein [Bryobacteraceae bacterium]|nr:polysaccharide biosynthesis/export family protein [Bryobacteraceae bacterium]